MRVIEQFSEIVDGVRVEGQREIEMPDVQTAEEAARNPPPFIREQQRAELRADMQAALADQALGLDVTDRIQKLREAYQKL